MTSDQQRARQVSHARRVAQEMRARAAAARPKPRPLPPIQCDMREHLVGLLEGTKEMEVGDDGAL